MSHFGFRDTADLGAKADAVRVALGTWRVVPPGLYIPHFGRATCGTACSFGGHLATWPYFRARGVRWLHEVQSEVIGPAGYAPAMRVRGPRIVQGRELSQRLFGIATLFEPRGGCRYDRTHTGLPGLDHALVTHRLRCLSETIEAAMSVL